MIENSVARTRRETRVGDVTVRAPSIDVRTVGAGGGSIAYVPELTKALRVGPKSAGAVPDPRLTRRAASCRPSRTPTWCSATCLRDARLGGDMEISRELAVRAVSTIAEALSISR